MELEAPKMEFLSPSSFFFSQKSPPNLISLYFELVFRVILGFGSGFRAFGSGKNQVWAQNGPFGTSGALQGTRRAAWAHAERAGRAIEARCTNSWAN